MGVVGETGGDTSMLLRNGDPGSSNTMSFVSPAESEVVPLSVLWREPLLPEKETRAEPLCPHCRFIEDL